MIYSSQQLENLRNRWKTPKGKKLLKLVVSSRSFLSSDLFRKQAKNFPSINDEEVKNSIDLRGVFLAGLDFRIPIQEADNGFSENLALLSNIHFEGATLFHCNIEDGKVHDCNFEQTDLSHSNFLNSQVHNCNFQSADLTGVHVNSTKFINCNFENATLQDVIFSSSYIDEKTLFGKKILSEKNREFHEAAMEYKQIKEMYKNSSLHDKADRYQYREMVAKRKKEPIYHPRRILSYLLGDLICKYGTSFYRVLATSALVMATCAFLYSENNSLYFHNTPTKISFFDALYFSIVAFTTVGFGDYTAIGPMRFLAAGEAFLGAILVSLFTVIVARKLIRD